MYYRVLAKYPSQSHCGKNCVLIKLLQCSGSQQGISISSNHGQAILGPVISRLSLFVSSAGLAYIQVFQVLPPLLYPENFPGFFSLPLIGILPISYLDVCLSISYIKRYFLQFLYNVL